MKKILLVLSALIVAACGTTSGIQQQGSDDGLNLDFSKYDTVYISNFGDGTKKQNVPEFASTNFSDRIVSVVSSKGAFKTVTKKPRK